MSRFLTEKNVCPHCKWDGRRLWYALSELEYDTSVEKGTFSIKVPHNTASGNARLALGIPGMVDMLEPMPDPASMYTPPTAISATDRLLELSAQQLVKALKGALEEAHRDNHGLRGATLGAAITREAGGLIQKHALRERGLPTEHIGKTGEWMK